MKIIKSANSQNNVEATKRFSPLWSMKATRSLVNLKSTFLCCRGLCDTGSIKSGVFH